MQGPGRPRKRGIGGSLFTHIFLVHLFVFLTGEKKGSLTWCRGWPCLGHSPMCLEAARRYLCVSAGEHIEAVG